MPERERLTAGQDRSMKTSPSFSHVWAQGVGQELGSHTHTLTPPHPHSLSHTHTEEDSARESERERKNRCFEVPINMCWPCPYKLDCRDTSPRPTHHLLASFAARVWNLLSTYKAKAARACLPRGFLGRQNGGARSWCSMA